MHELQHSMKPTNRSAALGDLAIIAAVCGVALLYAIVVKGWHPLRLWPEAALENARKAGVNVGHTP